MSDKVFAAFDDRKGPVAVYSTFQDHDIANKIAMKSIVSTLSAKEGQQRVEGEAIIPFPEVDLLGFIYYISLDQKTMTGDHRVISLTYLVPTQDSTKLYTQAELLSKQAKDIGGLINQDYMYGEPLSQEIQSIINNWGAEQQNLEKKELPKEKKVNLFDLFNLLPPETGFRKYIDPISYLILCFLYKITVVLSGPDEKLLAEFTDIIQELYPLKKLKIFRVDTQSNSLVIPKSDIVILTDELLQKCTFSPEIPILLLNTYQDLKLLNFQFDERDVKMISEWVKNSRQSTDITIIQNSLNYSKEKLDRLKYLAQNYGDSTLKEVRKSLKLQKEEIEFLAKILLSTGEVEANELNILFGSNLYSSGAHLTSDRIGKINF